MGERSRQGAEGAITPLAVPAGCPLVILFGGTFDPPHRAHVELPRLVREVLEREAGCEGRAWLVYIPAARAPLKGGAAAAATVDRLAMLELALRGMERACVWTDELDRAAGRSRAGEEPALSYTIETVMRARRWLDGHGNAGAVLRLLIGADQAAQFHRWKEPRAIIALAEPVVMARERVAGASEDPRADLMADLRASGAWSEEDLVRWGAWIVPEPVIAACSTDARAYLGDAGLRRTRRDVLERLLDPAVLAFIEARALYSGKEAGPGRGVTRPPS